MGIKNVPGIGSLPFGTPRTTEDMRGLSGGGDAAPDETTTTRRSRGAFSFEFDKLLASLMGIKKKKVSWTGL
jgi:hypothetical protein